jgi:predicted dehydrogenase
MAIKLGILGCGSVLWGPYLSLLEKLIYEGRVSVAAAYDPVPSKAEAVAKRVGLSKVATSSDEVIENFSVDAIGIFTSMNAHATLTIAALEAGKHVLVEKPMATNLDDGQKVLEAAKRAKGKLICAPHILLSPTYQRMYQHVQQKTLGEVVSARARYGWAGPWWGKWFYEPGGGSLFDLGIYNVTSLCGFMGSAKRVTAMTGVAIPQRQVEGEMITVHPEAEDNAHVLIDFGDNRFAVVTTGFTMQKYRSPAIELYGTTGVLQMQGDDWAPEGFELWRNSHGAWEVFPESQPGWPWTEGMRHLVTCIEQNLEPIIKPEHAYHVLEIILAAKAAGKDGQARAIHSQFPAPDYSTLLSKEDAETQKRRQHDPRSTQ